MMSSATTEVVRYAPLGASAWYLNFVSQYGAAVVTTIAIAYGVMQLVFRYLEHRAIMRKNRED